MLRSLFSMFLMGRLFRMFSGRRYAGHNYRSGYGGGWGSRHSGGYSGLSGLFGHMGRRRRGWV